MAGVAGLEPEQGGSHYFAITWISFVFIGDSSHLAFLAKVVFAKKCELNLSLIVPKKMKGSPFCPPIRGIHWPADANGVMSDGNPSSPNAYQRHLARKPPPA